MLIDDLLDAMNRIKNDGEWTENYPEEEHFVRDFDLLVSHMVPLCAALRVAAAHREMSSHEHFVEIGSYSYLRLCSQLDDAFLEDEVCDDEPEDEDEGDEDE